MFFYKWIFFLFIWRIINFICVESLINNNVCKKVYLPFDYLFLLINFYLYSSKDNLNYVKDVNAVCREILESESRKCN